MKMDCTMLYMGLLVIFTFGVAWQETVYAADGYVYVKQWGSLGSGPAQFNAPTKLAIDRNANILYVCDAFNSRVVKYSLNGNYLGQLPLQYFVAAVAVAADGTVYAAQGDPYGYMRVFNPTGREIRGWRLHRPTSITLDSNENVYVSWSSHVPGDTNGITKYTPSGTVLATWPEFEYDGLNDIEYDAVHNCIFGTNSYVNKIMKIQMDGSRTVWATVPNNPSCWYPFCLGLDNNGDILVTIHHCDNLKKFDYAGNLLAEWGSSGTGNGQFNKTGGVVVDNDGYVYVADTYNHRIQKFSPRVESR